jgi:hypothetical protein
MITGSSLRVVAFCIVAGIGMAASDLAAQTETIFTGVGADPGVRLVFPNTSISGATGIDFSFTGAIDGGPHQIDPPLPPGVETHILVTDFEWGPSPVGPWTVSPDNLNSPPDRKSVV